VSEGYPKLLPPAGAPAGVPLAPWSSAAYLKAATGPLAPLFHWMGNAPWIGTLDMVVAVALAAAGLSLMLGLFTQTGCAIAAALLAAFYVAAIPTGAPDLRSEGTYLLVNKNLIEIGAVLVLFAFRTGAIAGLDRAWIRPREARAGLQEAVI
jgi:thiosulfate dehydrogenase [quinone] large subunit